MHRIFKVAGVELENHLCKTPVWLLTALYAAFTFLICVLPSLRQSYFSGMESVPVMLLNFVAPVFLAAILTGTLSSAFAGDRENNTHQIPCTCLTGKKGRSIAKMLAAIFLSVLTCLFLAGITFIVPFLCGVFDGSVKIKYVGDALKLAPVWRAGQHFVFSFVCLTAGCVILALLLLLLSCHAKTAMAAASISTLFLLFAFLFNRFSFPTVLQEYNIWVFLKPYYFFVMKIFSCSPYVNLLLLFISFLPVCIFAVWQVVKNGT